MSRYDLQAVDAGGAARSVRVTHSQAEPWRVAAQVAGGLTYEGEGQDLFEALGRVREQMQQDALLLCCNGSRRNARPSPAMSAAGAEFVYLMPAYRLMTVRDIHPLFAPAPAEKVVGVKEQTEYYVTKLSSRKYLIQWVNPISWIKRVEASIRGPKGWVLEASGPDTVRWGIGRAR
ncbi:hypothetical protein GT039_04840 [Streptomyces sp. SID2955]|nr:hypothetical protein [Streptomyces sp. SID2955]